MKSVAEYADVTLNDEVPVRELLEALTHAAESGLVFSGVRRLSDGDPPLSKAIHAVDVVGLLPGNGEHLRVYGERCRGAVSRETIPVSVHRKGKTRTIDLKEVLIEVRVDPSDALAAAVGVQPGLPAVRLRLRVGGASVRPTEVVSEILGVTLSPVDFIRLHCWHLGRNGDLTDPLNPIGDRDGRDEASRDQTLEDPLVLDMLGKSTMG
jgi:hypothetical protein